MPAGHPPPISAAEALAAEPLFARAANVEKRISRCCSSFTPQVGHDTLSSARRTSFSKSVPQSWQWYSKIGMVLDALLILPALHANSVAARPPQRT
jgi:hypothetical protein